MVTPRWTLLLEIHTSSFFFFLLVESPKSFSSPRPLLCSFHKWQIGRRAQTTGKRKTTERLRPSLHLLHLSTVGFNSAIMWPLTLLALLMPTALLLKTVYLCLPVAVATALFFLVLHPVRFLVLKALFALSLKQRTTVFCTVGQNEQVFK